MTTPTTMTALVQDSYGSADVLRVERIPVPEPAPGELLIRVHAAGVDAGTVHLITGTPTLVRMAIGLRRPRMRVPGLSFAGTVAAVGSAAANTSGSRHWRVGDEVFGSAAGALAEFVVVKASSTAITRIPDGLDQVTAAALPLSAVTARQALATSGLSAGQRVLVIGAGGGVGSYAVALASASGASVTGVCSATKVDFVRSLGAGEVIDYTATDLKDVTTGAGSTPRWDVIIDAAGNRPLGSLRRILSPRGCLVIVGGDSGGRVLGGLERNLAAAALNPFTRQRLVGLVSRERTADLDALAGLVIEGSLAPQIDEIYTLGHAAEAVRHVEEHRARGKVVVQMVSS